MLKAGSVLAWLLLLAATSAAQQSTVVRPPIDGMSSFDPSDCPYLLSGDDGGPVNTGEIVVLPGIRGVFTDPLPAGSIVTKIEATVWAHQWSTTLPTIVLSLGPETATWMPATAIGEPTQIGTPVMHCNVAPPPQRIPAWHFASTEYAIGMPNYVYRSTGKKNALYLRITDGMISLEDIELRIFYEPPPRIEFGLRASTPAELRRLLLHRHRADHTYPSPDQDADLELNIVARVLRWNGEPIGGQKVYFRLLDPPDSAPYVRNSFLAFAGDNYIPLGESTAKLTFTSDTSDAAGVVSTRLVVPDHAAGNNFVVEGSLFDRILSPGYACEFEDCQASGEITTWKRVYLEHDAMFERGTLLWRDSGPSSPPLIPNDPLHPRSVYVHEVGEYRVGDTVLVVHAPRLDGLGAQRFYSEQRTVVERDRPRGSPPHAGRLVFDQPLIGDYYSIDQNEPLLADGAGILEPNPAGSALAANMVNLPVFANSFVEYVVLPPHYDASPPGAGTTALDPVSFIPRISATGPQLPSPTPEQLRSSLAEKWFFAFGLPNHQHVIGATRDGTDDGARGRTMVNQTNWTYVYTEFIFGHQATARDWRLNGEVTAHELGHQWKTHEFDGVNGEDHCLQLMWTASGERRSCTMIPRMEREVVAPGVLSPKDCQQDICDEWFDGIVGFHFVVSDEGKPAGEYMYIRRRPEPVPQVNGVPNP